MTTVDGHYTAELLRKLGARPIPATPDAQVLVVEALVALRGEVAALRSEVADLHADVDELRYELAWADGSGPGRLARASG